MADQNRPTSGLTVVTRRDFLVSSAATAALLATGSMAQAQAPKKIRVGVIGCGGRGSGAMENCIEASEDVEIVAIGDLFPKRVSDGRNKLNNLAKDPQPSKNDEGKTVEPSAAAVAKAKRFRDANKVTDATSFSGFDAYQKVIASGVDMVILATPPGFRPIHLKAAVEAGKHVFMEKPVAVDPAGIRSVIASAQLAKQKNLGIVAGTQRRHQFSYVETMKRLHEGAIGDIVAGQVYWNQGGLWKVDKSAEMSDTEWQIRNWLYFTWLSGDHIVEQHVHNLDVANWALQSHPDRAMGMGGRQVRTDPAYGHIYDHFTIEYTYPNGARVMSMCRQQDGTASRVGENFLGTKGKTNGSGFIDGANRWKYDGPNPNPYVQEHVDLIKSIQAGTPLNEGVQVAESTLTAIMGRLSAYTGQEVTWDQALNLDLDLMPAKMEFGPLPIPSVAVPGRTKITEGHIAKTSVG